MLLVTYPRSGTNWFINIVEHLIDLDPVLKGATIDHTHLGFRPGGVLNPESVRNYKDTDHIVLLRNARKSLVSNWFFMTTNERILERRKKDFPEMLVDVDTFLKSPYGVGRFSSFLARVKTLSERTRAFYFYEDMHDYTFLRNIPTLLGVPGYISPDNLMREAYAAGSYPDVQFGTDHSLAKGESLQYVQRYLIRHCKLDAYRQRYLQE
jgi:hypothetical protein